MTESEKKLAAMRPLLEHALNLLVAHTQNSGVRFAIVAMDAGEPCGCGGTLGALTLVSNANERHVSEACEHLVEQFAPEPTNKEIN